MARRPNLDDVRELVSHPRFGDRSVGDPRRLTDDDVLSSEYQGYLAGEVLFPQSSIKANVRRQKRHGCCPPNHYFDCLRVCIDCERQYLFFAREQQHWYEELGFFAGVGGERCYECRRSRQDLKRYQESFAKHSVNPPAALADLLDLFEATAELWKRGVLVDDQKLRRVTKLARREAPTLPISDALESLVRRLDGPA